MEVLRQKLVQKRKLKALGDESRKRHKRTVAGLNDLPWKVIKRNNKSTLEDYDDGILELEEVDGVEVEYEETETGKVAKFKVRTGSIILSSTFLRML